MTPSPATLVLASGSPRRREFLSMLQLRFEVDVPHIDETPRPGERPGEYVLRVAQEKARAVADRRPQALVLAADTAIALDDEILGKPTDEADARRMVGRLSGRKHQVLSGVALAGAAVDSRLVSTDVTFRLLSSAEIAWYVSTGEPMDKSGSYALQGVGAFMVAAIGGSNSNVIGLPLADTLEMLRKAGLSFPWDSR